MLNYRYEDKTRKKLIIVDAKKLNITTSYTANDINYSDYTPHIKSPYEKKGDFKYNTSVEIVGYRSKDYTVDGAQNRFNGDGWIANILIVSEDKAIFQNYNEKPYEFLIYIVDLKTNTHKEVYRGKTYNKVGRSLHSANTFSNLAYSNNILAFGVNRDLHIFNVKKHDLKVIKEYQKGGFVSNGHSVDKNKITKLIFDEHLNRLLVFCFNGTNNSYLNLSEL